MAGPAARARVRPLALAWLLGVLGVLGQLLFGACAPHPTDPEEESPPPTLPAGALGERSDQVRPPLALTATDGTSLRLVSVHARAAIEEPLAFTELHLVFENPHDRTIEGRFRIELPPRSAISRFAMKIGDHWQEGEVVERRAARVAYEDFLHRRQDP
ncbi:MAG TPA: VIT domain-containing protein, partial [Nannocystaceae bacterium]|nr:VIT domain-containing protein [Nannocystaceae bacterium]